MENIHCPPARSGNFPAFLSVPVGPWAVSLALHFAFIGWLWFLGKPLMLDMVSLDLELVPAVRVSSGISVEPGGGEEWGKPKAAKKPPPLVSGGSEGKTPSRASSLPVLSPFSGGEGAETRAAGEKPEGSVTRMPVYQIKTPPYPEAAKRANIEGVVILQVDIDATGAVKKVLVVQGLGYGCDEAAIAAVQRTFFSPAFSGSEPVPVRFLLPFRFQLMD